MTLLAWCGCGGGGGNSMGKSPVSTSTIHNQWTWIGGSQIVNQSGTYGMLGAASASNIPGGRYGEVSWTDASGNFWLFGGIAAPFPNTNNYFNDLWKYSSGQWTWMGGSNGYNQAGTYGTLGMPAPGNIPGARLGAVNWKDNAGNFWLFGGVGLDANGSSEFLNDLWEYDAGQWTWMGGSSVGIQNQPGIYGTLGTAAPGNIPGERSGAVSWKDESGNFWLFGGTGWDSAGTLGNLNDLWKYSSGEWTWMNGSNVVNQPGTYGTKGMAAPNNTPGARSEGISWTDATGNFWLFGGTLGPGGQFGPANDLWKYSAGQWTWMSGSNNPNQSGVYGTQGIASSGNIPGGRVGAATWTDASGNLWLFGGDGYDSAGTVGVLSDLWKYTAGEWIWMGGPTVSVQRGDYGILGMPANANIPGSRAFAASWADAAGNFWLLHGLGEDSNGTLGYLNDLWKYEP